MKYCLVCFQELDAGEGVRYPTASYEDSCFVHRDCLLNSVADVCQDEKYESMLRYIISFEEESKDKLVSDTVGIKKDFAHKISGGSSDSYWSRNELKLKPNEIRKLADAKVIGSVLPSRNDPYYALCGRDLIKQFLDKMTIQPIESSENINVNEGIFSPIIGYQDVKENLVKALNGSRKVHFLFEGVPSSSKTLFLTCIERSLGGKCYFATGSRVTGVGLTEALLLYNPQVLILDELDKVPRDALSVLLSVLESGTVIQTKHNSHVRAKVDTVVIGACNSSFRIPDELRSRFKPYHLYFDKYNQDEFIDVCQGYLTKYEQVPDDLARYIGERTWKLLSADVREARGIARMLSGKTKEEVDKQLMFVKKYRKKSMLR